MVALLKGFNSRVVHARGIAKCDPSDVFNRHIGKAIALGRALGLDVSEFENAVQPTIPVVGMRVEVRGSTGGTYKTNVITYDKYARHNIKNVHEFLVKITNDTNAIYEEEHAW